jgi:AraC family transcriptional regulator
MPRVLAYIDRHLDGDLGLAAVSGVAALSKFHFHLSPY